MESEAYDSSPTVFSPDGRLYQVEYAREAVKRGSPVVGITCNDGVLLANARPEGMSISEEVSGLKINMISRNIAVGSSGLMADARILVDYSRRMAAGFRQKYDECITPSTLTREVGDLMQYLTQFSGYRPMGVSMLIGGIDSDGCLIPVLYELDPSGSTIPLWAGAIGRGRDVITDRLKAYFTQGMSMDEAVELALSSLMVGYGDIKSFDGYTVEMVYVSQEEGCQTIDASKYL